VIYFGDESRSAVGQPKVQDSIQALKDLESALTAGLSQQDYMRRVADVKIIVDRYAAAIP